jgi:hypothetical protein
VAVVESDLVPFLEDSWKGLRKNLISLDSFMKVPIQKSKNPLE